MNRETVKQCKCGNMPHLEHKTIAPWGIDTGNTYYFYTCSACGHTTAGGGTGRTATGTIITGDRAKETALHKWNTDTTKEQEREQIRRTLART